MVLWFAILAPIIVAEVFRSPMVDYRVVAVGALLPLVEVVAGQAFVLHTLLGAVTVLAAVMLATQGRRLVRRRWLGIPIGLLLHLVLDGTWTSKSLMWWPVFGFRPDLAAPEAGRPVAVLVVLELMALAAGAWAWRRYELGDPANRSRLVATGQLGRGVL